MIALLVLGMIGVVSVFLFGMIASGGRFYLLNYNPSKRKVLADVNKMKKLLTPKIEALIPWSGEEINLLSLKHGTVERKKRGTTVVQGTFNSIYHEAMITYAYKKYMAKKENAVIYARTSNRSFEYRIKDQQISITINNKLIGILKPNGVLYTTKKKMLARINRASDAPHYPVLIHDQKGHMKELGTLVTKTTEEQINPRALQFIDPNMNDQEEAIFLSLVLFDMIYKSVK